MMDLYQLPYGLRAQYQDFFRLAAPLRALQLDFNYAKTRKALDPKWNGYDIPKGHDIIEDDVPLEHANLVTSRIAGSELHRVLLDLDYGSTIAATPMATRLTLHMHPAFVSNLLEESFKAVLYDVGITNSVSSIRWAVGGGQVDIYTPRDVCLIPSTTPGHKHLIMDVDIKWEKYVYLLNQLASAGVIERGYAKASIAKGFSAIRPPWVKK